MPGLVLGVFLFAVVGVTHAAPQREVVSGPVHLETSPQLFTTMSALLAAGYDWHPNAPGAESLVARMQSLQGPATDALRQYLRNHASKNLSETVSRYVTFALIAGPPPKFDLTLPQVDLPPDVQTLYGFQQVLASFYQEAQIESLWREYQPRYEQSKMRLLDPLTKQVLVTSAYLREVVSPGRRFTVYVEPLLGGQIHVRNIGDEYALVVNPAVDSADDMRHAFLHFLLDPVVIRYRDKLLPEDVLFRIALRAPRLPQGLRTDSLAFFAECLVHAVELRMSKLPPDQLAKEVDRADDDGLVLVRPLMPALQKFEAAKPAMSFYFPDLLKSIDAPAERVRLSKKRFPPAEQPSVAATVAPEISEKDRAVEEGDRLNAAGNATGAEAAYERALALDPADVRALYGSAVASLQLGNGQRAFDLFHQVVSAASGTAAGPDEETLAWAHVYLGRLYDLTGDRDSALAEYRSALAVAGAPEAARTAAQKGVDQAFQPAAHTPAPG